MGEKEDRAEGDDREEVSPNQADADATPVKKGTKTKGKKSAKAKADDCEFELMSDISKSISNLSNVASRAVDSESVPKATGVDAHELWSQLLAIKLRQLKKKEAEKFKNKVDAMILDLLPDDNDD